MSLKGVAKETLKILESGGFTNSAGEWVDIAPEIDYCVSNTRLYTPDQYEELTAARDDGASGSGVKVSVSTQTTQQAARQLVKEGCSDLVLLNFASARNPGGGFINGAKAQEEDLSRCSALYHCLKTQMGYYEANRRQDSMLYTDHVIYSPKVPWFRVRSRDKPDEVFLASVITAPAPNANQVLRHGGNLQDIEKALYRRAGQVLGVARDNNHRNLLLGAWGCGVFGNDPSMVAAAFKHWLYSPVFKAAFDRVVFAIYSKSKDNSVCNAFISAFE